MKPGSGTGYPGAPLVNQTSTNVTIGRANLRRLSFSTPRSLLPSRSSLSHAQASGTQLTTAFAIHLGAFVLSQRVADAMSTTAATTATVSSDGSMGSE
ncbi:hypothetical protein ACLKA6_001580 [Drosophila palustris]